MHADAFVSTEQVLADSVLTRTRVAVVDETVAVGSRIPEDAVAFVASHQVVAGAMLTGIRLALINLGFTIDTRPAVVAVTFVGVDLIDTNSIISTRIRLALVDFFAAVYSCIARFTRTGVVIDAVVTDTVNAWI